MQLLVTFDSNESFLTLEVGQDMTLLDLMGLIEIEGEIPADKQIVYYNSKQLSETDQSLKSLGFTDGDMILVRDKEAVAKFLEEERQRFMSSQQQLRLSGDNDQNGANFNEASLYSEIERVRKQMLQMPTLRSGALQQYPQLEDKIDNPEAFREEMVKIERDRYVQEKNRRAALKKLEEDPYDPESQQIILNSIRADGIMENFNIALEENPEVFASVTMLYVNIRVNGHPVKAFVDSGAQATIMSPECAEACSLSHLIDRRFQGVAMGVGTAKILGRVHTSPLLVGDVVLAASFTVMEGKSVDFLLGLDLLKKYQAQIDLKRNVLVIADTEIPFLPESEIPKSFTEGLAPGVISNNKPNIAAGPSSSLHGTPSSSSSSSANITSTSAAPLSPTRPASSQATASTSKRLRQISQPQQQRQPVKSHSEETIGSLMQLGFSREQVVAALDRHNGNLEQAAAQLFES